MVRITPISKYPVQDEAFGIRNLLKRTLERTEAIYERAGVPLPSRRYWALGQVAEDCDQVTVVFLNATLGTPGEQQTEPIPCNGPQFATVEVRVTRNMVNADNSTPPSPERIMEASDWVAVDAALLIDNLQDYDTTALGNRGSGVMANVAVAAPSGNLQTTTLTLTLGIL